MIEDVISAEIEMAIVNTIKAQCKKYRQFRNAEEKLFYEPYAKTRKKYELTAAVLSGFAPGKFQAEGVQVCDISYGRHNNSLVQPELSTSSAVIQIYSSGARPLKNKIVQQRCCEYNYDGYSEKRFLIVVFSVSKSGTLNRIDIHYPSSAFRITESRNIYMAQNLSCLAQVS